MICVSGTEINKDKVAVFRLHFHPFHPEYGLPQEEIDESWLTETQPPEEPPYKKGVQYRMFFNPITQSFFFEEQERPLTQDETIVEQNEKIDLLLLMQLESEGIL